VAEKRFRTTGLSYTYAMDMSVPQQLQQKSKLWNWTNNETRASAYSIL